MRLNIVCSILAVLTITLGLAQLVPMAVSIGYGEEVAYAFFFSAMVALGFGGVSRYLIKRFWQVPNNIELRQREGFAIVGLGWILVSSLGSLPFILAGTFVPGPSADLGVIMLFWEGATDSLFESVSGFSTTGASVLTDFDQPHGILFWRQFTHWIGGMGILVFSIAILPMLGAGGMQLFKAEVTGPIKDRLTPRIADTAKRLWVLYLLLTALHAVLLVYPGGMPWFHAIGHSFSTIATGGFSTYSDSLASSTPLVQYIIVVFMFLSGINFALHFRALRTRNIYKFSASYFKDDECRFYMVCMAIAVVVVLMGHGLYEYGETLEEAIRESVFQAVSIATTTGYASADYNLWHPLAHVALFFLMCSGGCAGSTSGGIKMMRVLLMSKAAVRELRRMAHPRAVFVIHLRRKRVPSEVMESVTTFLLLYLLVFFVSTCLLAATDYDFMTAMSASISTLSSIGPGLGQVGPMDNYAHFASWQKWLLSFNMLVGRLELYAILLLFVPSFWRR